MIAYIKGTIFLLTPSYCVVFTSAGVGYKVFVPFGTLKYLSKEKEVEFHIKTIVKEDNIELYGFLTLEEKETFEMLLGINKLGPKTALNIISVYSLNDLKSFAIKELWKPLTHVPGIGPKLAKRIIWELKEKLSKENNLDYNDQDVTYIDVVSALVNLGYKKSEAKEALTKALEEKGITSEKELIKEALRLLSRGIDT